MSKNKMPPQLLEHFKKKAAGKQNEESDSTENKTDSDDSRRKEAVKKARVRMEEKSRSNYGKQKEAGQERS